MKQIFEQIHRYKEQDFEEGKPFEFTLEGKRNELNTEDYICSPVQKMEVGKSYKITVKKYMTEPATVNFDFHLSYSFHLCLYYIKYSFICQETCLQT